MKIRNLPVVAAGICALALLAATGAQAQSTWTCENFTDASTLGAKVQTLTPDVQLSAKIVVRQFQSVAQLKAAASAGQAEVEAEDTVAGAKVKIPGATLGHMIFIDHYNLLLENQAGTVLYNSFTSEGDVATALNGLPDAEADGAKVVIEQFTAQLKRQKRTPLGQLRLDNQYILFYLAPFAEATANACGSVGPTPTPTASSAPTASNAPTPTQVPTAISSSLGGGTPTPTATAVATAIATLTPASSPTPVLTPIATPTEPCVLFGGQPCGPATPTPFFSSPTPTAACVEFGGFPCPPSTPIPTFAVPTPTEACVLFGGQPCPTATPTP
jgi:hypothetical protein